MPAANCVDTSKEAVEALFAEAGKFCNCYSLDFDRFVFWQNGKSTSSINYLLISGNEKRTLADKKNYLDQFKIWCQGRNLDFDDVLLKDENDLRFSLVQYLASYRVKTKSGEMLLPKTTTMNKMISMLKSELERLSGKYLNCN